jgi:hypothetical protein
VNSSLLPAARFAPLKAGRKGFDPAFREQFDDHLSKRFDAPFCSSV